MSELCVTVYSRRACHLCEDLLEAVQPLIRGKARLRVVDIDSDPDLVQRYNADVPVVEVGGKIICQHFLDTAALAQALG